MQHHYAICVQCGYCCTIGTCVYGVWNLTKKECKFLGEENKYGQRPCTIYDQIKDKGSPSISPFFFAGCDFLLFNEQREKVKQLLSTN